MCVRDFACVFCVCLLVSVCVRMYVSVCVCVCALQVDDSAAIAHWHSTMLLVFACVRACLPLQVDDSAASYSSGGLGPSERGSPYPHPHSPLGSPSRAHQAGKAGNF